MLRYLAGAALLASSAASAGDYDWHDRTNRMQMATIFDATAKVCAEMFGFTRLPPQPKAAMAEKIDAYLLLRDDPDKVLMDWISVFKPVLEIGSGKPGAMTLADDERGGAALVAAAKDPSLMAEAQEKYVSGAMGPFRRALEGCSAGASDPFLGKHYLAGHGSADDIEKDFRDSFAKEVDEVRNGPPKRK